MEQPLQHLCAKSLLSKTEGRENANVAEVWKLLMGQHSQTFWRWSIAVGCSRFVDSVISIDLPSNVWMSLTTYCHCCIAVQCDRQVK